MEATRETMLVGRDYQVEMLHESLAKNIIVAVRTPIVSSAFAHEHQMDTGSGKTQIAILRMAAELERCPGHQMVWFLCPTVALARQQHDVIALQLPHYPSLLLVGHDGVDRWSTRKIWDDALHNVRIVVSTPKVLLDALLHSLVGMADLALLVFDEGTISRRGVELADLVAAHHCQNEDAGNRIMIHVYHPRKQAGKSVPHILGLTASPLAGSSKDGLQKIESNLNAISKTPKAHRNTYAAQVHLPSIQLVHFASDAVGPEPLSVRSLLQIYRDMDVRDDPYVKRRKLEGGDVQSILLSRKTYCQDQIKGLLLTARRVHAELGSWAVDRYIALCREKLTDARSGKFLDLDFLDEDEKRYLERMLAPLAGIQETEDPDMKASISAKVQTLIDLLANEDDPSLAGLVFVETRAAARLLTELLTLHPQTRTWMRVASFVGESNHAKRKGHIKELAPKESQTGTLDDFRSGRKNVILATSALEEGIDISACNLVICFQKPQNLRTFIQRRGRARQSTSKYIIMLEEGDQDHLAMWQQLEEEMKAKYMDDMRTLEALTQLERVDEARHREFVVPTSGAKLMLQDATAHLYHFCHALPAAEYAAQDPAFLFDRDDDNLISARVLLPRGVDASVREFQGTHQWRTERAARSDAAFVAYVALYHAGLLNDHLLPLSTSAQLEEHLDLPAVSSTMEVQGRIDPWPSMAALWDSPELHVHSVHFATQEQTETLFLVAPRQLPVIPAITLYLDANTTMAVTISHLDSVRSDSSTVQALRGITTTLYSVFCKGRMKEHRSDYPILFTPTSLDEDQQAYLDQIEAIVPAMQLVDGPEPGSNGCMGLIRHASGVFYEYRGSGVRESRSETTEAPEMEAYLTLKRVSKRTDFLHPIPGSHTESLKMRQHVDVPAQECTASQLPASHARLARLLPSILHQVENSLVTEALCTELESCHFQSTSLLRCSITATASREAVDYQRLEFLGDGILKVMASLALFADHPTWHEGYLTAYKSALVSNKRLALAAQTLGLDKYILTRAFTGLKWRPGYNTEILQAAPPTARTLSTKTLADVAEALLGAAYLDGGESRACDLLLVLFPHIRWLSMTTQAANLSERAEVFHRARPAEQYQHLEALVGHHFSKPFLALEAITHPSHLGSPGDSVPSYQRLEFLGDAVLDFIITERIYSSCEASSIPVHRMHLVRTAMVNANFLAFLGMRMTTAIQRNKIHGDPSDSTTFRVETSTERLALWQFLRFSQSQELAAARQRCAARFEASQSQISEALIHGTSYPWSLLIAMAPEKMFSDIIESMLGAIYIDSAGSLVACGNFLTRLGVLPYLDRVLDHAVKVWHPKEELGVLAVDQTVRYRVREAPTGFACEVFVGEASVARIPEQRTRILAETLAAEKAIERLGVETAASSTTTTNINTTATTTTTTSTTTGTATGSKSMAAECLAERVTDGGEQLLVEEEEEEKEEKEEGVEDEDEEEEEEFHDARDTPS